MIDELVDPISYIRSNPAMFLRSGSGQINGAELAGIIVSDALLLTKGRVTAYHEKGWWVIGSDSDWLVNQPHLSPEQLFLRIVPFPEAGPNSMRGEVLLTAFAQDVATTDGHYLSAIKGVVPNDGDPLYEIMNTNGWKRVLMFRLTTARPIATTPMR